MRKFVGNYLSGRVKTTGPGDVTSDRYDYISLDQAEPNFGVPTNDITSLSGSAGDNVFMMSTAGGTRRLVSIGDDLSLEEIGQSGYYKIGLSAEATTNSVNLSTNASSLQTTLQVGMSADRPITLTNTQDVSATVVESGSFVTGTVYRITQVGQQDWESIDDNPDAVDVTYAVGVLFKASGAGTSYGSDADKGKAIAVPSFSVAGGLSLSKTLQLNDTQKLVWVDPNPGSASNPEKHDVSIKSTHSSSPGESFLSFKVGSVQGNLPWAGNDGWTDANQHAVRIVANKNYYTGKQVSTLILGRATADGGNIIAGDDAPEKGNSESIIQGNQTIIIDPVAIDSETGTVRIRGDLEVLGTQTTINSTTLTVADKNLQLADGATTSTQASTAGFTFGEYPSSLTGTANEFVSYTQHIASSNVPESRTPVNETPQLVWETNSAPEHRFKANKKFESTGFLVTGATSGTDIGILMSDGSVSTVEYEIAGTVTDTTYDLSVDAGTNGFGTFKLVDADGNEDTIDLLGTNGVDVSVTAATAQNNALITIDGTDVAGTTYSMTSSQNTTTGTHVDLNITNITGTTSSDVVTFKPSGNLSITTNSDAEINIFDSNTPSYSAAGAKVTINNTQTSGVLDTHDINDLALQATSATAGSVVKFARSTQGDHHDGGVLLLEVTDNDTSSRNPWISLMNEGTAVDDDTQPCQGEITTKYSVGTNKSGIRVWGQTNIDFDVSNTAKPADSFLNTRASITGDGLVLHNASDIIYKGGSYKTTLQFTEPATTDRTITFPDAGGTVALVENLIAGGPIATHNGTTNSDQFIVFAETAVSPTGPVVTQNPLTNTNLKFNPSTGKLTVNGEISVTGNVSLTGTLTAATKSFLIDHPTKDGMKLQYASLEGPENGVYVRGRLKDSNIIELPDYWVGLVHENSITVNLTPIGHSQNLYVQDIVNNQIIINDNENINCFYTIFAERKDVDKLVVEYEDV